MTPYQFNEFSEAKQRRMLLVNGAYLGHRAIDIRIGAMLFQYEGYYAEVQYRPESWVIESIEAFEADDARLDAYLEQISITLLTA